MKPTHFSFPSPALCSSFIATGPSLLKPNVYVFKALILPRLVTCPKHCDTHFDTSGAVRTVTFGHTHYGISQKVV